MEAVDRTRKELFSTLKDKSSRYWELMKSWYKRRISKEDFDAKAKSLLGEEGIQLHNEFLFAILVKCHVGVPNELGPNVMQESIVVSVGGIAQEDSKRLKLDSSHPTDTTPYGAFDRLTLQVPSSTLICGKDLDRLLLCCHELLLPDPATLQVRMLLEAWECGLEGVSEVSVQYMMIATKYFLKNVIAACIVNTTVTERNIQKDNVFQKDDEIVDFMSGHSKSLQAEALQAQHFSKTHQGKFSSSITLFHLRDTLLASGSVCIPNHFVRHCFLERIISRLWHPDKDELKCKQSIQQWQKTYTLQ